MRVRFTENFDYRPAVYGVTVAYKAGMVETVKRDCGEKAIAEKKAVLIRPKRSEAGASDDP